MAAHYVEEIRTLQPEGPYALGGLCIGGVIAFEMAQQLRAKGETVDVVALLDSSAGNSGYKESAFFWNFLRDLPSWLIGFLQLNRFQWRSLTQLKVKSAKRILAGIFRSSGEESRPDEVSRYIKDLGDVFGFSEQHRKVARAQHQALRAYRPRVYPGKVTLFRARKQGLFSSHAPDKGWGRLVTGGLEIKAAPGNHLGMLQEPLVRVLAQQLRDCLDKEQNEIGG